MLGTNGTKSLPVLHAPTVGVQDNGPGVLEALVDKHLMVLPVQLGDLDGVLPLVTPVKVAASPVQRNAIWTLNS